MRLPVTVQLHDDENAMSFASRLAIANGYPSLQTFLATTGLKVTKIEAGNPASIEKLAELGNASPHALRQFTMSKSPDRLAWNLGGATFNRKIKTTHTRLCSHCICRDLDSSVARESSRPYLRAAWLPMTIENCPDHKRPLISFENIRMSNHRDFARIVHLKQSAIRADAASDKPPVSIELDSYLSDSIIGTNREPFLDTMQTHIATDVCKFVGQFLKRNSEYVDFLPPDVKMASPREQGFWVVRQGPEFIESTFKQVIVGLRPRAKFRLIFGDLTRWLRMNLANRHYSMVIDLFQGIAERNLPMAEGEVFIRPVSKRVIHTVRSASKEYGLQEVRVRALLKEAGVISGQDINSTSTYFPAHVSETLLAEAAGTMTSAEVADELGLSIIRTREILNAGLLNRVERRHGKRHLSRIRRDDFKEFRHRLFSRTRQITEPGNLVPLYDAASMYRWKSAKIISAIIHGHVDNVGLMANSEHKVQGLYVDIQELAPCFSGTPFGDQAHLSLVEASRRLRVNSDTMPVLIRLGYLGTVVGAHPTTNRRHIKIDAKSLAAFQENFVSIAALAQRHGGHPIAAKAKLAGLGILPIYDKPSRGALFYRKLEVDGLALGSLKQVTWKATTG